MNRTKLLIDYLKDNGLLTYDEVARKASEIEPRWKVSTWERSLRRTDVARYKNAKGHIYAYEYRVLPQIYNKNKELKTLDTKKQDKLKI